MKKINWIIAAVALLSFHGTSTPVQAQTRWSFCYHYGDVYDGHVGWRVVHCVNLDTKEELFVYTRI
jgi:hypothetical protein